MKIENEWLKAAKLDIESVTYIYNVSHLTSIAAFHCQQAVEKSLKALLEHKRLTIPRTHKLQTLLNLLNKEIKLDDRKIQILDELYIDSRYPGDLGLLPNGNPTIAEIKELYEFSKQVYYEALKQINE